MAAVVGRASSFVAELEALAEAGLPPLLGSARGCSMMRRAAAAAAAKGGVGEEVEERWGVVLVAHGDVLQILQTAFDPAVEPSQHRSLPHLPNAELRPLNEFIEAGVS